MRDQRVLDEIGRLNSRRGCTDARPGGRAAVVGNGAVARFLQKQQRRVGAKMKEFMRTAIVGMIAGAFMAYVLNVLNILPANSLPNAKRKGGFTCIEASLVADSQLQQWRQK
ncbi:hypothetical protein [Bradyrhizobium glycinis]|uniref:hypothetical protein n=1 Tax=Bradyrhizobium glycinis TaxID=2751812 RepID=UPI0018D9D964|nr:hypothetical protein [Bradyrhizobium glycinis]MBH5372955.1 hypothetical protein [Bradyrhizobium glycinis]